MSATASPRHANSFTLVATVAAALVCVRHSGVLLGDGEPTSWIGATPSIGLALLLATSGWLLVAAWDRDPRVGAFALRRVLRIWPSLALVLLLSAFVLGPIATTLPWDEYVADPGVARYVLDNLMLRASYSLPGVFADNPYPYAVNGTLWSLSAQVACFGLVPLLGALPQAWRWLAWSAIAAVALALFASGLVDGVVVWATPVAASMLPIGAFAVGAAVRASARRIPWWLAVLALPAFAASSMLPLGGIGDVLSVAFLAIAAVGLGSIDHPTLRAIGPRRNVSLGIFLLGFPVQQALIVFVPQLPSIASMVLALACTILGAIALDVVVERPVGRLRRIVLRDASVRTARGAPIPSPRTPIA